MSVSLRHRRTPIKQSEDVPAIHPVLERVGSHLGINDGLILSAASKTTHGQMKGKWDIDTRLRAFLKKRRYWRTNEAIGCIDLWQPCARVLQPDYVETYALRHEYH